MSSGTGRALLFVAAATLAAAACFHLAFGRRGPAGPEPATVEMCGPNVAAMARLETKRRLAGEIAAGRLSLLEGAAAFKALDAKGPPYPGWTFPNIPPGASRDEIYCRMVIAWAQAEAPPDLVCRLQAELEARLQQGSLVLPGE